MDTIIAVLVGSGVSIIGNLIQYWIGKWREESDWVRKQQAADNDWNRTNKKEEQKSLREAYQNAISSLSLILGTKEQDDERPLKAKDIYEHVKESQKWLARIYLRHPSDELQKLLREFSQSPHYDCFALFEYVIQLARADNALMLGDYPLIEEPKTRKSREHREVRFLYDDEFRKQQFVRGRVLPKEVAFQFRIRDLSDDQRQLLVDCLPATEDIIPNEICLPFPSLAPNGEIDVRTTRWQAKIEPDPNKHVSIFASWCAEYKRELERLQQNKSKGEN